MTAQTLLPGDNAPRFAAPVLDISDRFVFDTVAGRAIVLLFLGSAGWPAAEQAMATYAAHRHLFDDDRACCFGISIDPADVAQKRIRTQVPGLRWVLDQDLSVSRLYGAVDAQDEGKRYHPQWLLLDRMLRVVRRVPLDKGEELMADAARLIVEEEAASPPAPVLVLPRVLDPDTCRALIALYEERGGEDSGFMNDSSGITEMRINHGFKRRYDCLMPEGKLLNVVKARLKRFLVPQIQSAFQFEVTRVERWLIACYDGDNGGGHFKRHRDNTTHGTAHRKFACTINLNAEEYDGGELCFPEFGTRTYRASTGGAVVFSCSLLHEALPVTRGKRYALLPFFYDDAGARLRERNLPFVNESLQSYRSGLPPEDDAA